MSERIAALALRAVAGKPAAARGRLCVRRRLAVRVAPGYVRRAPALLRSAALTFAGLFGFALSAAAATPPGTQIDNQALALFQTEAGTPVTVLSNTASVVTVFGRTPSQATFTRLAAGTISRSETIGPVQCALNGTFTPLPAPLDGAGQPIDLTAAQTVADTGIYNTDETAFVRLDDGDQNLNGLLRETVTVTVSNAPGGDSETLTLTETGNNTGVFTGYVPLAEATPATGNCVLETTPDSTLSISYADPADNTDASQALALVEPLSIVFDASTGQPVDGATITLVDAATGQPATVFGNDGVSTYPATVVSGAPATDAAGIVYNVPAGGYRFPVLPAGDYRLQIVPPAQFIAPSNRSVAELNSLPGAPFDLATASFGGDFTQPVDGAGDLVDVPLDPFDGGLFLSKRTTTAVAGVGDFVRYELGLTNASERVSATGITVSDVPPQGFRYVAGSARLNGNVIADPVFADATGSAFTFTLPDLPAAASATLAYVMEITPGARGRQAINIASARADRGVASNEAQVSIRLREDLFRSTSVLVGRVVEGNCTDETFAESQGVAGVRVFLEDGRFAVTDDGGRYHLEGLTPGRRVAQLDDTTVPEWLELVPCDAAPRFGGRADSQWVDLKPGLLHRADFYLKRRAPDTGAVSLELVNESGRAPDTIDYRLELTGAGNVSVEGLSATVLLPKSAALVPGTARLNGQLLPSPRQTGNAVVFVIGERAGGWRDRITFSAKIDALYAGELVSRAVANFNTPATGNQRTPVGEARMLREAATTENAEYVLSLNFDVLSAELSADDRETLDALIETWRGVYDIRLAAAGHSDADRIAARNRHVFADNYALSEARAAAAARYLASALDIDTQATEVRGFGPDRPVASNDTADGKRRNRRVELIMSGTRPGRQSVVEVTQAASGVQRVDTTGATPGPETASRDALDEKIARVTAAGDEAVMVSAPGVEALGSAHGFVAPAADYQPPIPSLTVVVAHAGDSRVELSLNGEPVSNLNFDGTERSADKQHALSSWRGVDLVNGDNTLIATVLDANGVVLATHRRAVHYAGQPIRGELVASESRLIANGRQRPVIGVRLLDGDDQPARAGSIGSFRVRAPYRSWFEVSRERENRLVEVGERRPLYRVGDDGIAYLELEPTTRAGEVIVDLEFENGRQQELRTYLAPAPRDWILVGFAEGTVGYNTLRDNVAAADAAGFEDDVYTDGRVAFFAKGRIKGDALLTLAYDTSGTAVDRDGFGTEVDPDAFFTLYGDGTETRFEAASQRKLYIKLERRQFSALFGDFDTGLSVTELARYERRFNGLQVQYFGDRFTVNAFAAESDQSFQRDDIPGDGTSGLYRLSGRDIVVNSDAVRIETRDRFDASVVIASERLTRFLDYDIDYINGTLFFKRPVPSRDQDFNPLVIVAEYESRDAAEDDTIAGGRASIKALDGALEVGVTAVQENNAVDANALYGVDVAWQIDNVTRLTAEYADTDRNDVSATTSGYAYKIELERATGALDARLYHRLSDSNFGLGAQAANQLGIEATGLDARWQHAERWFSQVSLGRQENLDTGVERQRGEAEVRYQDSRNTAFMGLAFVSDEAADGLTRDSSLARAGVGRSFFGDRITLRLSTEQAIDTDESLDYPSRTLVGLDWKLAQATLFAEHEVANGEDIDAQTSRVGLRATPWQRAQFVTTLDNQVTEFGPRLFANVGFIQGIQIGERWTLDLGVDHSNTLIDEQNALVFDADRELTSGSLRADFVAAFAGALYQSDNWSANARYERRSADDEDRDTVLFGWFREPVAGHGLSAGLQYFNSDRADRGERRADLRFGWAYRKADRRWAFLDRLDLVLDEGDGLGGERRSMRFINNFNAVRRIGAAGELSLQYAVKYVDSEFDGVGYSGYTDLAGIDYRRSFRARWDWGVHGSAMTSYESGVTDYGVGVDLGFNPRDNLWLTLGYNFSGFRDEDFDDARYTATGPYLRVTIKADQHTLKRITGRIRGDR
ncbi:MAG: OmpA family protein [Pseudomonadota bacterium]